MRHIASYSKYILDSITRKLIGTITHVATQDAVVVLTFDDGPHPSYTPRLLDILSKHQAMATFFMVGKMAKRYPEIVKLVAKAGHAIGNHSWDHPSFPLINGRERRKQIRACAKVIAPYGQRLFRPPYGHQSLACRMDALLLGYQVITWSIVACDWLDHDADWMVDRVISQIQPGSVILFHDGLYDYLDPKYADRQPTLKAVETLLNQLSERYRFVTVPELLRNGKPQRRSWYMKADVDFLNQLRVQGEKARRYIQKKRQVKWK